jgi:hypothetical protein
VTSLALLSPAEEGAVDNAGLPSDVSALDEHPSHSSVVPTPELDVPLVLVAGGVTALTGACVDVFTPLDEALGAGDGAGLVVAAVDDATLLAAVEAPSAPDALFDVQPCAHTPANNTLTCHAVVRPAREPRHRELRPLVVEIR